MKQRSTVTGRSNDWPNDSGSPGVLSVIDELVEQLRDRPLIDHHVHGAWLSDGDRSRFENALNEGSADPLPGWDSGFDNQLGFAIRAHCAPVLDLEPHAAADAYWQRRTSLGEAEVARRFLSAAGVSDWLVDTGFPGRPASRRSWRPSAVPMIIG